MKKLSLVLILILALAAPSWGAMATTTHGAPKPVYNDSGEAKATEFNSAQDAFDLAIWNVLNVKASLTGTETLTNKRVNPRTGGTQTITSSATPIPDISLGDQFIITALAEGATFGAPTGTPVEGQKLIIRIKDDGTARALAWNAIYREGTDVAKPLTTIISKTMYCNFIYNATDTKWDFTGSVGGF
jgi:hypothetical protein